MLKLMRLEIRKNKLGSSLKAVIIANLGIIGFLTLIYFAERSEGAAAFATYESAFTIIDVFVRATFMIFASVWIAKLIIDEYKNRTISLMFMYPINRKKILGSKLAVVFLYTFLSVLLSNVFIIIVLYVLDQVFDIVPEPLMLSAAIRNMGEVFISALSTAGMGLIPLFFGMWKKSVPATIVSAILLNTIVTSNWGEGTSLYNLVAIPIGLAVIGVLIAYLTIRNVHVKDL